MALSSVKLLSPVILAHFRCVPAEESPTLIQQTVSCAYRKSMAVVCFVFVWSDGLLEPLRDVIWMF